MRIEKFEDWFPTVWRIENMEHKIGRDAWNHQEQKLLDVLDFISLLGQQKELDHFLKNEKGWE